ncbi:MAG: CAP domain-containing protein [Bacteroidota bacterium]
MIFSIFILFASLFGHSNDTVPDFTTEETICVSTEEEKLYNAIMAYRDKKKLKKIPFSAKLTKVSQAHVKDLAEHYDFEPNKTCNPHSWSDNGKWSSCCYTSDHKKAACMWDKPKEIAGYSGSGYEIAFYYSAGANADMALKGWQKSQAHNPLLVNTGIWKKIEWNAIGIGIYEEYAVVWFGQETDASQLVKCR